MPRRRPEPDALDDLDADEAPGTIDGLNPDDPGVRMLGRALARVDPRGVLLVHCGELPGVRAGATRLILDLRERVGAEHACVPDVAASSPIAAGQFEQAAIWPRAHLGKDFSERCLALACLALREGGRVLCAVRKQKGGKSLARTMKALLGEDAVEVIERERGYHLWAGRRGPDHACDLALAEQLLALEYRFVVASGRGELELVGRPGVFSRRELDAGSAALLAVLAAVAEAEARSEPTPRKILDLCAGVGPLGLAAAHRWPRAELLAVESNLRACALLRENAERNGMAGRVRVFEHDGLPRGDELRGVDLALLNPPTHADPATLARLLDLRACLAPRGRALIVVKRAHPTVDLLAELGAVVRGGERDGYFVLEARWP